MEIGPLSSFNYRLTVGSSLISLRNDKGSYTGKAIPLG